MKELLKLKARIKVALRFYYRKIIGYLILFGIIFLFAWLFDKVIETVAMMLAYFATRFAVPKIKHFNTTQKCITVSTMTFLFGLAILCLPKNLSIVWNICVGCVIPVIMYIESLLFDPVISDKDKLIALCKKHNYNSLKTEMAIKFFIDKEKPKDVWLWLLDTKKSDIEWDTVKHIKSKMKKELFTD